MSQKYDYCEYYISKCEKSEVPYARSQQYKTKEELLTAYINSFCYLRTKDQRVDFLLQVLPPFIFHDFGCAKCLDANARKILERAYDRISHVKTYEDIFCALSDYLWVRASIATYTSKKNNIIYLVEDMSFEALGTLKWLKTLYGEIKQNRITLSCVKEADELPILIQAMPNLIRDSELAYYADIENFTSAKRKHLMDNIKEELKIREMVYFASLVTNNYRDELRRRYR